MKKYNDTIVKKSKYKNYFEVDVNDFLGKKYNSFMELEQESYQWNLEEQFYNITEIYNYDSIFDIGKKYIQKKTGLSDKDIKEYTDNINDDIYRAITNAYTDNYIQEFFEWIKYNIDDKIRNELQAYGIKEYEILYYSSEDKTLHDEFMYNTTFINISISSNEIRKLQKEFKEVEYYEVINEFAYDISFNELDFEYFDYYGTKGHYDNWYEYFNENEETSYQILQERKKYQKNLKRKIKNKVELIYR